MSQYSLAPMDIQPTEAEVVSCAKEMLKQTFMELIGGIISIPKRIISKFDGFVETVDRGFEKFDEVFTASLQNMTGQGLQANLSA